MTLRIGSLFAGIGGFDLGFERAGFEVAWCVEKDAKCRQLLARRFPGARIYEDVQTVPLYDLQPVDVITGGFPCQDLSVAGKRAGLAGSRSGLFHDAMSIVRHVQPRIVVVENVPGLHTSNHGHDFATVLREMGAGWNCSEVGWRILDSRYFGVAQRRRRIFIIAGRTTGCAEEILAIGEGRPRNSAARGKTRKDIAADAQSRATGVGECRNGCDFESTSVVQAFTGTSHAQYGVGVGTLRANGGDLGGGSETLAVCVAGTHSHTLTANGCDASEDGTGRGTPIVAVQGNLIGRMQGGPHGVGARCDGFMYTLTRTDIHGIAVDVYNQTIDGDTAATLTSATGGTNTSGPKLLTFKTGNSARARSSAMIVRRLTPVECERLQGFPDGWTDVQSDSTRYRQLGNAVTVNVAEWIAHRTRRVLESET